MANTICLINQKGGCGKSSTCFHLGGQLAAEGDRVLLVDTDPQGSLSQAFFGSHRVELLTASETLAAAFRGSGTLSPATLTAVTPFENLDIVRANHYLAVHNTPEPESLGFAQYALEALLRDLEGYDWVLFDCPPNLYACSWNALQASSYVVVPVPPEDFGTQGLRAVHQAIDSARQMNPRLRRLGHLVTRSDGRLLVHRAYEQKLRRLYDDVFESTIPEAAAFKVALTCRQPVAIASPRSKAALSVARLATEIRSRIRQHERAERVA